MKIPQIFAIYKPADIGSTTCLGKLKRRFGKENLGKIGHFGTLDPFAEGLLLIGINGATRLNEHIHNQFPKTYLSTGDLTFSTDSGDLTGTKKSESEVHDLEIFEKKSLKELEKALQKKFIGPYLQKPPMYSASKFEGKPLHFYARKGETVERKSKERFITKFDFIEKSIKKCILRIEASSGTYIRTLFEDFAETQGLHGHLCHLVREKIGPIDLSYALKLEDIEEMDFNEFCQHAVKLEEILPFPMVKVDEVSQQKFRTGQVLAKENQPLNSWLWVCNQEGMIQGLGRNQEDGLRPKINFFPL